jgi:N-acetylglucosamine-6-sulfatase
VRNNSKDGGCYSKDFVENHESKTFPAILNENGYATFYAGKYLNQYYSEDVPKGYDFFFGLHGNSKYYNYSINANGVIENHGDSPDDYYTNVIRRQTKEFLSKQNKEKPFLAIVSTPSCHAPFTPEEKYKDTLKNLSVPRSKNFNVGAKPNEKHWLMTMKPNKLSNATIEKIDKFYHNRLETLLTVDDLVEDLVQQLDDQDLLDDTYIIFTSDNGYHLGNWAMPWDKRLPYETDIKVPLIIRGPNINAKEIVVAPVLLLDLAPTILSLANISYNSSEYDGISFDYITNSLNISSDFEERQILIEHFGEGNFDTFSEECPWRRSQRLYGCSLESECKAEDSWNNTYACVRHFSKSINFLMCKFQDREEYFEAYDLTTDIYQLENIAYEILPSVQAIYQIMIEDLRECKGDNCREIKNI